MYATSNATADDDYNDDDDDDGWEEHVHIQHRDNLTMPQRQRGYNSNEGKDMKYETP